MAVAVTKVANINGYTTPIGNRALGARNVSWNTGTYPAGGLPLGRQSFGLRGFDIPVSGGVVSAGGIYVALLQTKAVGAAVGSIGSSTLYLRLIVLATGVEVATGAALTADSVVVGAIGG